MLHLNIIIFVSYFSTCVWNRYQSILFLSYLVPPSRIGLLKSIGYFVKLLSAPAWAALSDVKYDRLSCLIFCYIVGTITLYFVQVSLVHKVSFAVLILLRIMRSSVGAVGNLTDSLIFETTKDEKVRGYGRSRMYGSIAWGVGSVVGGIMIDRYGLESVFSFTFFFCGCTILGLMWFKYSKNAGEKSTEGGENNNNKTKNKANNGVLHIVNEIKKLLILNEEIRAFCICITLNGFVMTLADSLLPLQIEALNGSRQFSGLTTLVSILGGIPVFYHSKAIYLRYGPWWMIRIGSLILSIRLLILATCVFDESQLKYILVVQLFHGITFALIWTGSTENLQRAVKNCDLTSSIQTLINTLYFTVGQGIGNVFWGHVYEHYERANEGYFLGAVVILINIWMFRDDAKFDKERSARKKDEVGSGGTGRDLVNIV